MYSGQLYTELRNTSRDEVGGGNEVWELRKQDYWARDMIRAAL